MNVPKVELGRLYTGKREVTFDSRTGAYSESLPLIAGDALELQRALLRPAPAPMATVKSFLVYRDLINLQERTSCQL